MAKVLSIGRVSGLAVALGVGAVIAANPGVAYAESEDSDSPKAGSETSTPDNGDDGDDGDESNTPDSAQDDDDDRPLTRLVRALTSHQSDEDDDAASKPGSDSDDDDEDSGEVAVKPPRIITFLRQDRDDEPAEPEVTEPETFSLATDTSQESGLPEFTQAAVVEQVRQLFGVLAPPEIEIDETEPEAPSDPASVLGLALTTLARRPDAPAEQTSGADAVLPVALAAAEPHNPDPFRDEPVDTTVPEFVRTFLAGVQTSLPDEFDPIAREAFEAAFRVSQMIPWVNAPVPLLTIASILPDALAGNKEATQIAIQQLILTLPTAGIVYYGFDQIADTLNYEAEGAALKQQAIDFAWDTIDFAHLLHP